jgi:hypothetical protein
LDDQDAHCFADPLHRYATETRIPFLARFGHVTKSSRCGGVCGVHNTACFGGTTPQTFAKAPPRLMHSLLLQTFCRTKLKRISIAKKVYRTNLCAHRIGDKAHNFIQSRLPCFTAGHHVTQTDQQLAAFCLKTLWHVISRNL